MKIKEHDIVILKQHIAVDNIHLCKGFAGTVISVNGDYYTVEFPPLTGEPFAFGPIADLHKDLIDVATLS